MQGEKYTFDQLKSSIQKYKYDTSRYSFASILRKVFNNWQGKIENLYLFFEGSDKLNQITMDEDTKTRFHRQYYDSPHYPELLDLYYQFVKEVVLPIYKTEDTTFAVQKDPCFRIHLPNNTALGKRINTNDPEDKIGYHNDSEYGHPDTEINFMLSFGNQHDSNSCYVETEVSSDIYIPLQIEYGEFMSFYGNKLRHFNKLNTTGEARVSLDFRIIPMSLYDKENINISLHGKRPFLLGGYYVELTKE
jgi:hypothetical protein